jgi:hypothetical protein
MEKIKVHLLNAHHFSMSHMPIILENISDKGKTYYKIDVTKKPENQFSSLTSDIARRLKQTHSIFTFTIEANPSVIIKEWKCFFKQGEEAETKLIEANAGELGANCIMLLSRQHNCAGAAEWFLNRFAGIPKASVRSSSLWKLNYLGYGISVPRVLPIGIPLPGRVMDDAKMHIKEGEFKSSSCVAGFFTKRNLALAAIATAGVVGAAVNVVMADHEHFMP